MNQQNAKIVYAALTRLTEDRGVIKQAFDHWNSQHGDAELDVVGLTESIVTFLGLDTGEKKVLMVSLHSASSRGAGSLADVPSYLIGASNDAINGDAIAAAASPSGNKPPVVILADAYCNYVDGALRRLSNADREEWIEVIRDEGVAGVKPNVQLALQSIDDGLSLPSDSSEEDCKTVCHELTLFLSDVIGPVKADEISYKAIASLLDTNEASRFDPRELLED